MINGKVVETVSLPPSISRTAVAAVPSILIQYKSSRNCPKIPATIPGTIPPL
jgi:hypothetical protein